MLLRRFFLVLLLCMPCHARGSLRAEKEAAARAHYQRGAQLYRMGDYAGAWLEFTTAHQLVPRPELLFNMARCEVKLGRPAEALAHFEAYLEAVPHDPDAEGIRREINALRSEVNQIRRREEERKRAQMMASLAPGPEPRRPFPTYSTLSGAGTALLGIVSIALLSSVASQYGQLDQACAPNCRPEDVYPLERQATAGYVFLGLTAAAGITTAALLTWELRRGRSLRGSEQLLALQPARAMGLAWRF
ncbi:MAG: tetratricopeptide repeat protein [Myxococcales bacterium]|nr:tetratricopeptide repeat protein [Myxococcota bacterium]MDW8283732.1 tetratricopeptide repeat protein [Myxococcales bacterium]